MSEPPTQLIRQSSAPAASSAEVSAAPTAGDEARRQMAATERRFGPAPIGSKVKKLAQSLRRQRSADDLDLTADRYTQSQASKAVRPAFFCSRGQSRNRNRVALDAYKATQLKQLDTFRAQAAGGRWASIHHAHYDWYCFPIEDGSQPRFNVFADDVSEMLADDEWLERYLETVELVARAWGWDIRSATTISPPAKGMGWTSWDVRLAKMIRSLWLFGRKNEMESLQAFALFVKPRRGLSYGRICLDEVYDMRLE